uniref:NADH dehydrogenase subunit 6 n=1 Tax=Panthalis oerstedi TaxID=318815 RepID=A0A343W6D4_9ANNE|nr:NADH dehydrogenase subunit 6 [Panthalis oerstedi]
MTLILSMSMFISLSFSIILSPSPLSSGLWVLLIALATAFSIAFMFHSWFALIVFLTYIGGMLVMFAYFTALTPNHPMKTNSMILALLSTLIPVSAMLASSSISNNFWQSIPTLQALTILYAPNNVALLLLLAMVLFFALVAVVKVANIFSGPLRPFSP